MHVIGSLPHLFIEIVLSTMLFYQRIVETIVANAKVGRQTVHNVVMLTTRFFDLNEAILMVFSDVVT